MKSRLSTAVLAAVSLTAIIVFTAGSGGASAQGGLRLAQIGSFDAPVHVAAAPGSDRLLFVVEQPGSIRVLRDGTTLDRPFLDIRDRVKYGGEQGLLSIAFDPGYAHNRRFYVYYVNNDGNIEVDGFHTKRKTATRAEARSREKVIVIPHPTFDNHNGGQLQFGPDGHLYLGTGDGGSGGDPDGNAQNKSILLGKLLRIDPRRNGGYSVPKSNPFRKGKGRAEIYATGLRNPYRFTFDSKTKDIWIGDVGQDEWEEIDHVSAHKLRGANFGWDRFEGDHVYEGNGDKPSHYRPPVLELSHDGGYCAVIGGYVVRDNSVPALDGRYVYSDNCNGTLRSFDPQNPGSSDGSIGLDVDLPSSFGLDSEGHVYVTSLSGPVYRIAQNYDREPRPRSRVVRSTFAARRTTHDGVRDAP
jgi:glucose/arabinose dehydrogenase